ncbi:hypothetical protein CK203_102353 [Vitis vinifera]|uniref:Uncharacterized protein n=1 Tax=Vitis vinifera TaxID=29760 RepID=A0A438BR26_VITVI|nr:hypothetical protein CK203_102353 [Vitis vinifera]
MHRKISYTMPNLAWCAKFFVVSRGFAWCAKFRTGVKFLSLILLYPAAFEAPLDFTCYAKFLGKLKSRWIGPFTIPSAFKWSSGNNSNSTGSFKVNGHRLKPFVEHFSRDKEEFILLDPHQA